MATIDDTLSSFKSMYQSQAWHDVLELAVPGARTKLAEEEGMDIGQFAAKYSKPNPVEESEVRRAFSEAAAAFLAPIQGDSHSDSYYAVEMRGMLGRERVSQAYDAIKKGNFDNDNRDNQGVLQLFRMAFENRHYFGRLHELYDDLDQLDQREQEAVYRVWSRIINYGLEDKWQDVRDHRDDQKDSSLYRLGLAIKSAAGMGNGHQTRPQQAGHQGRQKGRRQ